MPRNNPHPDRMTFDLSIGALARIMRVLRPGETRAAFVREAVDEAVRRREGDREQTMEDDDA